MLSHLIPKRYMRAQILKRQFATHYKFTHAIRGGAWVYTDYWALHTNGCIGWYPWPVIRLLNLKDMTPKW